MYTKFTLYLIAALLTTLGAAAVLYSFAYPERPETPPTQGAQVEPQTVVPATVLSPRNASFEDVFRTMLTSLPPCEFEDSPNCSWDASGAGNGMGTDFFDLNGMVFYWEGDVLVGYDEDAGRAVRCSDVSHACIEQVL